MIVDCAPVLRGMLRNDALTRGLGDIEARMLVEWLVQWIEVFAATAKSLDDIAAIAARLSQRARGIGRFVQLWCDFSPSSKAAAFQLAACERFQWPLPTCHIEPADLMRRILDWENQYPE